MPKQKRCRGCNEVLKPRAHYPGGFCKVCRPGVIHERIFEKQETRRLKAAAAATRGIEAGPDSFAPLLMRSPYALEKIIDF